LKHNKKVKVVVFRYVPNNDLIEGRLFEGRCLVLLFMDFSFEI